jgi:aspartate carbamoyltransferase catalytic subunit
MLRFYHAGDGMNEHLPRHCSTCTQCFSIRDGAGPAIAIAGDLLHSRVARSNLWARNNGALPSEGRTPTMLPRDLEKTGALVCPTVADAVRDADVVMGLRVHLERQQRA